MSFLNSSNSEFLSARITSRGRNAIAKGSFNIEYFQVGDSEFDYTSPFTALTGTTNHQKVFTPFENESGVKYPFSLDSSLSTTYGNPILNNSITPIRNVMGPAGFVSDYKTLDDITIACPIERVYYSAITGTNTFTFTHTSNEIDYLSKVYQFQNTEYVTLVCDQFGGNPPVPVITGNSSSFIYKKVNFNITSQIITGSTTGFTITLTLDRNTPVLTGLTGYAQVVSNKCEIEYPLSNEVSPVCSPEPYDPMGQLNPWTLDIVWGQKPIGGDYNGTDESLSGYTSNQFISTKNYLGYTTTGQTFSNFTGGTISGFTSTAFGTGFANSFSTGSTHELIEVLPSEQRCIAIVHYSELGDLRNDPERFFKYDDYISHCTPTGVNACNISIVQNEDGDDISDTEYFEIYIPFIYYHRNTTGTFGAKFTMDITDYYIRPVSGTTGSRFELKFRYLLDEQNNKVGKVFVNNKIVVFDDQELVAILDYRSNRRYTFPSPKLGLTPSDGVAGHSMLSTTGQTVWVTYMFGNTSGETLNALPCNYFNKISTVVGADSCGSIVTPSQVTMKFSGNSFSNMSTSLSGVKDGFVANKFYALVQTGATPSTSAWRKIDLTSQITGYTSGYINPTGLTGVSFTINYTSFNSASTFDLEDHMSGVTSNYLNDTELSGTTLPQFGDEQPFPGSIRFVRSSDIQQMNFLVNLPSGTFGDITNSENGLSQNPTHPITGTTPTYITEIALLDSNKEPLVVAKTSTPVKRAGTQVFAVKLDF